MGNEEKKKGPEPAVFKPRRQFMWGPKCIEPINRDDDSLNLIKLTKGQVMKEMKLGMGKSTGGKVRRPVSPVLNHCDLVSADKQVMEDVTDFMAELKK